MTNSEVCVVMPAFNESGVIDSVLREFEGLGYCVVLVDDGSTDDTYQRALGFPVTVLRHACNLGQGAALQTGISYALRRTQTKFIVTFDTDGQHVPGDIPRLLEPLRRATHDVVLGSRFISGGRAVNMGVLKNMTLKLAVTFTRLSVGLALTDTHNGLRAFTAEAAAQIFLTQNGMAHASELLAQIKERELRFCEVPVTVRYTAYSRAKGQSVLNGVNILWEIVGGKVR
ncbi:MAG TPA: glycosyltransferase family 2 protein [Vicinamibacterales bacterium]|jgi:glycosyltransferase involved in cell wall biosynthesis|nr:glycosyltransferase family 2 protein [Vicinamibacterales bacterium]